MSQASPEERKLFALAKIAKETRDTEASFTSNLALCIEHYVNPFRGNTSLIKPADCKVIFSNIEGIHKAAALTLSRLNAAGDDLLAVANVFIEMAPSYQIYAQYVCDYSASASTFEKYMKNKEFAAFVRSCRAASNSQLDLPSLMIMPIQRIPRYVLLLQELVKHSDDQSPSHARLCKALESVRQVADAINEHKRASENVQRLVEIQDSIQGDFFNLVEPHRILLCEGVGYVRGPEVKRLFLFNDVLIVVSDSGPNKYSYVEHFLVSKKLAVEETTSSKAVSMKLAFPRETVLVSFDDADVGNTFVRALQALLLELSSSSTSVPGSASSSVGGGVNVTTNDILKECTMKGYLVKKGGGRWQKRFFMLRGQTLFWFVDEKRTNKPLGSLSVSQCDVEEVSAQMGKPNTVALKRPGRNVKVYYLQCDRVSMMRAWMRALRDHTVAKLDSTVHRAFLSSSGHSVTASLTVRAEGLSSDGSALYLCALTSREKVPGVGFKWQLVCLSDMVAAKDGCPEWKVPLKLPFAFSSDKRLRFVVFEVDVNQKMKYIRKPWKGLPKAGVCYSSVSQVVKRPVSSSLVSKGRPTRGTLKVDMMDTAVSNANVVFNLSATGLDKKDGLFGKSDPMLVFQQRHDDGTFYDVYSTDFIEQTLNPTWPEFLVPVDLLCGSDYEALFKVQCLDWNKDGKYAMIGEMRTVLRDMLQKKSYPLIEPELAARKRSYKNSGTLNVDRIAVTNPYSLVDYLRGGLRMRLAIGVDFNEATNGNPDCPTSLHSDFGANEYRDLLQQFGGLFSAYGCGNIAAYGLSAGHAPLFELGGEQGVPEVDGTQGLLDAYQKARDAVHFGQQSHWAPFLQIMIDLVKSQAAGAPETSMPEFWTVVILCGGDLDDEDALLPLLLQCVYLPIAVCIIGVGPTPLSLQGLLDRVESQADAIQREVVSVTETKQFGIDVYDHTLASATRHLADEVAAFMHVKHVVPPHLVGKPLPNELAAKRRAEEREAAKAAAERMRQAGPGNLGSAIHSQQQHQAPAPSNWGVPSAASDSSLRQGWGGNAGVSVTQVVEEAEEQGLSEGWTATGGRERLYGGHPSTPAAAPSTGASHHAYPAYTPASGHQPQSQYPQQYPQQQQYPPQYPPSVATAYPPQQPTSTAYPAYTPQPHQQQPQYGYGQPVAPAGYAAYPQQPGYAQPGYPPQGYGQHAAAYPPQAHSQQGYYQQPAQPQEEEASLTEGWTGAGGGRWG